MDNVTDTRLSATPRPAPPPRVLGRAFDDEVEQMIPGRRPAGEEGSTWEIHQDEGTYPAWL